MAKQVKKGIEQQVLDATSQKAQGKKESREDYLERLALSVQENLDDEEYEALSDEVKAWFEKAAKALSKSKAAPEFPDMETEEEEEVEIETEDEEEAPVKVKTKAKGNGKAVAEKETTKKKVAVKKGAPKGDGYKGHRSGTKAEKAHKMVDDMVKAKKERGAVVKALVKLGIKESTAKSWYAEWA